MNRFNYIIFDFDGTLFDTGPGIMHSVQYALKQFGIDEHDSTALRRFIGPPLFTSFKEFYGFSDEDAARAVEQYRVLYNKIFVEESFLYPGMDEILKSLRAAGMHLSIATGKPEHFAVPIAEHSGLLSLFDILCGISLNDKSMHKKELIGRVLEHYGYPDLSQVVMIGDRASDITGAHEAGIKAIGVRYGYAHGDELEDAGADFTAQTVEDVAKLLL